MKKNYLILVFALIFNTLVFSQTVTLTPTAVNNSNVNSGPINLASTPNSTISLGVKVQFPSNASVNDYGTLKIYYTNLSITNANVAAGGDSGNLLFNGGQVANKSFVINLYWNDFLTSGGFIYAEYKTASNTVYRSSNLVVIKNATMTAGTTLNPPADAPNPSNISNTLCCNQTIRLGDKPQPITGSQYSNPYKNEPYGINESWETNGNPTARISSLDNTNKILNLDYITQTGNFTVKRSLGYNYGSGNSNKSNSITITVVPSPIGANSISTNETTNSEGFIELSNLKKLAISGLTARVNLNILQNSSHIVQPRDPTVIVDSYKWEYKATGSGTYENWSVIPNENYANLNFSDPLKSSNFEDTYYIIRRIAIYQNISQVSNEIKIVVRGLRYNNTICCDQILKIQPPSNFESPQIINGSLVEVDTPIEEGTNFRVNYITYQWQNSIQNSHLNSNWTNIQGATTKDYTPSESLIVVRDQRGSYKFSQSYKYRRIANVNYSIITNRLITKTTSSYSNEISLDGSVNQAYIQLYPNPATSILNIESNSDISNANVTISNVMGTIVNSNNFSIVNPKLININVANLPTGTYFINIESQSLGITQRTFIKQ